MIVRYTRRAQNDLANILNYLDKRSPRGARSVKLAIRRTVETIGQNPNIGHPIGRDAARGTVEAGEIWVLHIRHGARRVWRG